MTALQTFLAILPGIVFCLWMFWRDRHEREPFYLLLLCFFAGVASAYPAIILERFGQGLGVGSDGGLFDMFILAFVVVAFSEELVKLIAVMLCAYPWKPFNEPLDGIVYSLMVSMGFATIENILYSNAYGMETVILRAFTAVPAHAMFGIIMGYHLGWAKFKPGKRIQHILLGLGGAVLVHGAYDFFLFQQMFPQLSFLALVTLGITFIYTRRMIRDHDGRSPFREKENDVLPEENDPSPPMA